MRDTLRLGITLDLGLALREPTGAKEEGGLIGMVSGGDKDHKMAATGLTSKKDNFRFRVIVVGVSGPIGIVGRARVAMSTSW
jgi:hypothetical protein